MVVNPSTANQELAALWALDLLDPVEAQSFHAAMMASPELLTHALSLQDAWAALALSLLPQVPPSHLKAKTMAALSVTRRFLNPSHRPAAISKPSIRSTRKPSVASNGLSPLRALPWVAAVAMGGVAMLTYRESRQDRLRMSQLETQLQRRAGELHAARSQVATTATQLAVANRAVAEAQLEQEALLDQNSMNKMEIASLLSTLEAYKEGVAVVLWNPETQEGVLKLERMPLIPADKDYQLWVIDTDKETPVDAGVVKINATGVAKINFKPQEPVTGAGSFALSLENKYGSTSQTGPQGPVVMMKQ